MHAGSLLNAPENQDENGQTVSSSDGASVSIRSVRVVESYESFINDARGIITTEMENMVLSGLASLVRREIAARELIPTIPLFIESNAFSFITANGLQSRRSANSCAKSVIGPVTSCRGTDTRYIRLE